MDATPVIQHQRHERVVSWSHVVRLNIEVIHFHQAFRILQWRSQQTNTKLRDLAAELVEGLNEMPAPPASLRNAFDHLLLTVHERAGKRG